MEPARQIFWNIESRSFLTAWGLLVALSLLAAILLRLPSWKQGRTRLKPQATRGSVLRTVLTFKGIRLGHLPVRMHRCMFYGFILLGVATVLVGLQEHVGLPVIRGRFYLGFELAVDAAGLVLLVGLGIAAYIRYIKRAGRLESRLSDAILLILPTLIVLSGYLLQGLRLLATQDSWGCWAPVGFLVALAGRWLVGPVEARAFHVAVWHSHVTLAMVFLILAPWTKLTHVLALPVALRYRRPAKEKNHLEDAPGQRAKGTATLSDLPLAAHLEVDACMYCGRCRKQCPISISGIPFAPETLLQEEKRLLHTVAWKKPLLGTVITEDALWSCTACRSCEERCPMGGDLVARIVDIRRSVATSGKLFEPVAKRFKEAAEVSRQPAGGGIGSMAPESIYIWPGCHTKNEKGSGILKALLRLIIHAGLSPVVLEPPRCCAGPDRLLGNEAFFVEAVQANLAYLKPFEGMLVVTPCPHCYTTLKYEYPVNVTLKHHVQFLQELHGRGLLPPLSGKALKLTYHDPCFLGRYHAGYEAPRQILSDLPGVELLEMKQSRQKSHCCGSGGGTVMTGSAEENARKRLRQAQATGAELLVTSCPYCRESLQREGAMGVEDIAEVLARKC